ncbi:hypothetical protein HNP46_006324 [Pseudomonas nitritireducens]|uniref:Uncharacterized protein n=1 Tax=Pseudomonas nitroreducens TaxID=46680 RepID=A0A7W7P464_PSENT|nr:hypothetical protein [Pseudomonas nitritireducens]MBB4867411.1 hypothetical protein [Pseudomonas nitritireducens]
MAYSVTPEQVASITDVEVAFSTERLLPAWDDIPDEFKIGNEYTRLVEAIFYGRPLPQCNIEIADGLEPAHVQRCTQAHLKSHGPKHEHKMAGVAYMLSCFTKLSPVKESEGE